MEPTMSGSSYFDFSQLETLSGILPNPNTPICPIPDYLSTLFTIVRLHQYYQHELGHTNIEWKASRMLPPQEAAFGLYSAQLNVWFAPCVHHFDFSFYSKLLSLLLF